MSEPDVFLLCGSDHNVHVYGQVCRHLSLTKPKILGLVFGPVCCVTGADQL